MNDELELSPEESELINEFLERISGFRLSNDDKVYLSHFPKALLDNNFIGAVSIGFVFLEKYLRTKLLFAIHAESHSSDGEFLDFLDEVESNLENGKSGADIYAAKRQPYSKSIQNYGTDQSVPREQVLREIEAYLDFIDQNGASPDSKFSFNNICAELFKRGLLAKDRKDELITFYAKYRNTTQHGLFKRLVDIHMGDQTMPIVAASAVSGMELINVDVSHILFREENIVPIFKDISIDLFNLIGQLFVEL